MAKRAIEVTICNRCGFGKEQPATESLEISINGSYYRLDLCQSHSTMFDRDISSWTRLADEIEAPPVRRPHSEYFTEERKREAKQITELRQKIADKNAREEFAARRAAEIEAQLARDAEIKARQSIPGALNWRFTDHARERMIERGFTVEEVLRAAAQPQHIFQQPWRGPHITVHQHGDCRVAVNENTKAMVTVIDRSDVLENEATVIPQKVKATS